MAKIYQIIINDTLNSYIDELIAVKDEEFQNANKRRNEAQNTKKDAGELGDLRENDEYQRAKHEVSVYSHLAKELRDTLTALDKFKNSLYKHSGYVSLKSEVTLSYTSNDGKVPKFNKFILVIPEAGDVSRGFLPIDSVVGAALLGKKVGDSIYVETGFHNYTATVAGIDTSF